MKNKVFNKKVLTMMIKENIENNRNIFKKDINSDDLIIQNNDIDSISTLLSNRIKNKTNISIDDIDISIDDFLSSKGYIFDTTIEKKYKKSPYGNYYYFGIVELKYYGSAVSMDELILKIKKVLSDNYEKIRRSTRVFNDLVNINIVKDNSSKFIEDKNKIFYRAGFNVSNKNLILNLNIDEMNKLD